MLAIRQLTFWPFLRVKLVTEMYEDWWLHIVLNWQVHDET